MVIIGILIQKPSLLRMGPAKDKLWVCKAFAKIILYSAKNGHFRMNELWSTITYCTLYVHKQILHCSRTHTYTHTPLPLSLSLTMHTHTHTQTHHSLNYFLTTWSILKQCFCWHCPSAGSPRETEQPPRLGGSHGRHSPAGRGTTLEAAPCHFYRAW